MNSKKRKKNRHILLQKEGKILTLVWTLMYSERELEETNNKLEQIQKKIVKAIGIGHTNKNIHFTEVI